MQEQEVSSAGFLVREKCKQDVGSKAQHQAHPIDLRNKKDVENIQIQPYHACATQTNGRQMMHMQHK